MRTQVTRKALAENYYCIAVGYCELQSLLKFCKSPYYNAGTYGWNFDAYTFEFQGMNLCITTGYRSTIQTAKPELPYATIREYDKKAYSILSDNTIDRQEQEKKLDKLVQEFLTLAFDSVLKGGK